MRNPVVACTLNQKFSWCIKIVDIELIVVPYDGWMNTDISEKMGSKERGMKFPFVGKSVLDI